MIVLDTELTGTQKNEVCQLAYLDFSSGTAEPGNLYFEVDEMSEYAFEVHGLSRYALHRLSGGRRFSDHAQTLRELLLGKCVVGHSIKSDLKAIRDEFRRAGVEAPAVRHVCTMTHFAPIMNMRKPGQKQPKNPSLVELCDYLAVWPGAVREAAVALYGAVEGFHDARFDVCATYLCVEAATRAGMLRGLIPDAR